MLSSKAALFFSDIHGSDARHLSFASVLLCLATLADQSLEAQLICGAIIWQFFGANESLVLIGINLHRRNGIAQCIMVGGRL